MENTISGAMGEAIKNAAKVEPKKKSEWKHLAFLTVGIIAGLMMGYQMNLEKTAHSMATGICGTCQENIGIMVNNFNVLGKTCSEAKTFKDVAILPALGLNQTVRTYAP